MELKHSQTVQQKLYMMLKTGIVTLETSSWSFHVVLVTENDVTPKSFVSYRILKPIIIMPDWFPLSKIQGIFVDLAGGVFFGTLTIFLAYLRIKMGNYCK